MTMPFEPRFEILSPPQIFTFIGSFGHGFSFLRVCFLRFQCFLCVFIWTLHSSVDTTSSSCSFVLKICWHHSNRLGLFASRISWQYFGVVKTQPNWRLALSTVLIDIGSSGYLQHSIVLTCWLVSSSLSAKALCMRRQCKSFSILEATLLGQSNTPVLPVWWYFAMRRYRVFTERWIPSSCNLTLTFL